MFAKLLTYAEGVKALSKTAGILPRRNVVRLTSEEWNELTLDPVFQLVHDPRYQHVILHDVVFRCDQPISGTTERAGMPHGSQPLVPQTDGQS